MVAEASLDTLIDQVSQTDISTLVKDENTLIKQMLEHGDAAVDALVHAVNNARPRFGDSLIYTLAGQDIQTQVQRRRISVK